MKPAETNASALTNLTPVVPPSHIRPEWRQPTTNFYTLGPGDRLEIEALDDPTTRDTVLVGPDGKIHYYLLPGLQVWGLTLAETKEKIEAGLAKYIQRQPRVALTLRGIASKQVWLIGRFNAPGVYSLSAPTTLLEAIAMAGGPATLSSAVSSRGVMSAAGDEDIADLRRSFVIRGADVIRIDLDRLLRGGDMAQNIYLLPGDFVLLPAAVSRDIYILGGVRQPTVLKSTEPRTLISAVAYAGGTVKNAYLSHVAIVRGSWAEPKMAIVDYQDIVRGHAADVRLEPGDLVYVPLSPYRTLTRYAELILDTFVRTVGINEGARAITRQAGAVGVNVPIGP
ncbi:MAG: polysaccharide export protein [Verrucomicrobia bacterium]|nr:polysaccharide export protein [Verrucomicrobiota bacterium]